MPTARRSSSICTPTFRLRWMPSRVSPGPRKAGAALCGFRRPRRPGAIGKEKQIPRPKPAQPGHCGRMGGQNRCNPKCGKPHMPKPAKPHARPRPDAGPRPARHAAGCGKHHIRAGRKVQKHPRRSKGQKRFKGDKAKHQRSIIPLMPKIKRQDLIGLSRQTHNNKLALKAQVFGGQDHILRRHCAAVHL